MDKKEFDWKKQLIELEHKSKMEWSKYIRETERLKHEMELERGRIKNAQIQKSLDRKENHRWLNDEGRRR